MKYPKILCVFSIFIFMGIGVTGIKQAGAEGWTASFEAFKQTDEPTYHQRHDGNIEWHLFHGSSESKSGSPKYTDIYWIEGENSWNNRIASVKRTSRLDHLTPAKVSELKTHSPCPLCDKPTYFWLDPGDLDSDSEAHIKSDFPDWSKEDGVCRNCFECYQLRAGKYYDGNAVSSTTDEYVIGYDKSDNIRDYFTYVK